MPLLTVDLDHEETNRIPGSNFGYSAATIDHLEAAGASEYTLATVVVDESGSVAPFRAEMEGAIRSFIEALKKHPRGDYLLVRLLAFREGVREVHGFRLLADCEPASYDGCLQPSGMTALYAASVDAVRATEHYAERLVERDFSCNAITVVITDGLDNRSADAGVSAADVQAALDAVMRSERLESHVGILVGVNVTEPEVKRGLAIFESQAGFSQYVELGDASPETLARLGNFMARSVSSQSQSLGTGGPSQPLTF